MRGFLVSGVVTMIDFKFIQGLEGNTCKGYVPDASNSQSGVTIASGFDLGARSPKEIVKAFTPDLSAKLFPYCQLKGESALKVLKDNPLTITEEEAADVNRFAKNQAVARLTNDWAADSLIEFSSLPIEIQTVVASVAFQYGSLRAKAPNFWRQITQGKWRSALKNLRNFGDRYPTRRNKEADLLEAGLKLI